MFQRIIRAILAIFIPPPLGDTFFAAITNVVDADSLEFRVGWHRYSARLVGVDGPEYRQEYGDEAFCRLRDLAYSSRDVTVERFGVDKFNRMLVRVTVGGRDLALEMLDSGCAWHSPAYSVKSIPQHAERYAQAMYRARAANRGLWRGNDPVHPAQFRAAQRGESRLITKRKPSPQLGLF